MPNKRKSPKTKMDLFDVKLSQNPLSHNHKYSVLRGRETVAHVDSEDHGWLFAAVLAWSELLDSYGDHAAKDILVQSVALFGLVQGKIYLKD